MKAMFLTAIRLPKLRKIDRLFYMNLSSVEPELFAVAVSRLEVVRLQPTYITKDQMEALQRWSRTVSSSHWT